MAFDYLGATKAGYTPEEIAVELKSRGVSMDVSGAKKAGYSDDEIASEINSRFSSIKSRPPEAPQPPKVAKKTSGNLLMDTEFSKKPTYTLPKEISEDTKTTAPQKLAKEEEHKDYGRTSRAFQVAKQKSKYGMPTEREVEQAGGQLSAPTPLELDEQGKPTTGGLEAPWVSPEFAGAGAVRAGVAALGKDALKVASGKGFIAGSIGGDVAAWGAHETVDKSLTDEFKKAHPMLSEAMKVSAALVGGVAGGMAAERRYMQQYQTLLDDVKEGVIPPKQAEEVLRQDSGVSEVINKVEETRSKYAEERSTQDEAIASGINKELYPEAVAPIQQAEQPPLSPLMEKVNAKLKDMGHEPLVKPMPVQAQRIKDAQEIPVGGSEDAAKDAVAQLFKPTPDTQYKKMTAAERQAYDEEYQRALQYGKVDEAGEVLDDFGQPLFSKGEQIKPSGRDVYDPINNKTYTIGEDGKVYWYSPIGGGSYRETQQWGLKQRLEEVELKGADEVKKQFEDHVAEIEKERSKPKIESDSYRMEHKAPSDKNGSPSYDLSSSFPDDIYSKDAQRLYGHGDKVMDNESLSVIKNIKSNPDAKVTIYRAVPKNVKNINDGDWVTTSKIYAKQHGDSVLKGDYQIVSKEVSARDIFTDGNSIHEWGYNPQHPLKSSFATPDGTTTQSVRTIARKFLGKQYNKLKDDLNIVQTFDDLPEDLRKRTGLQTVEVGGKPRGIYDPVTGKAHLIADSMTDKEVQSVIAHELLHRHIQSGRQVLGADYDTFVLRLKQLKEDKLVKEAMDAVRSAGAPVKHMNEETMAYLVEKYQYAKDISPKLKHFISDIVEKVKVFITETAVKLGVKPEWLISKMSADEIAQVLKSAAMKSGKVKEETADTLFSKAKQTISDVKQSSQPSNVQAVVEKAIKKNIVEKTLDTGIQKIVTGAIKIADVATARKISGTVSKIIDTEFVKNLIGHKIYQETEYLKIREEALIGVNRIKDQAMKLHNQLSGLSKEAKEAMHDYMTGYKGEVNLTPELKKLADNITRYIDEAGQKLVDEGVLSKEAYEAWKGQYLHRSYTSKMEKAKDIISGRGFTVEGIKQRGKTWEGTTDELYELEKSGAIGKVSEGLIEAETLPNGKVKFRRDWTREERTKMGEVRDAAYTVPETMARLAVLAENSKLLRNIPSHLLLEQGKRTDDEMKELGYTLMRGERYGALNGKWLSNTVADDIKRLGNDMHGDKVAMAYKEYLSAIKASHTIYNTVAHVNNTVSNVIMQFTAGLNPVKAIVYASQAVKGLKQLNRLAELESKRLSGLTAKEATEIAKIESNKTVQLLQEAQELGLFGRSGLADILKEYLEPSLDIADSTLSKVKRAFSSAYEAEDNIMRFSAYKQLKEQGMSPKEAMHKINKDIIPDYTNPISKYARWMRDWGFVPFMSWTYHSTPIILKQIKNNPTRALALIGGIAGIDAAFGINPFNEEDIPQEGFAHQHIVTGREGDKVDTLRISSMLPHSQMIDPWETYVRSMLTGGIPQLAVGTIGNHNFYFNKPITRKEGAEGVYQMGKHIVQNVLPSPDILDKVYNLAESKVLSKEKRRYDPVIQPKTPAQEAASFFVNVKTYDKSKQRQHAEKERLK